VHKQAAGIQAARTFAEGSLPDRTWAEDKEAEVSISGVPP